MTSIKSVGSATSADGKQFIVGWKEESKEVFILNPMGEQWEEILKSAKTEKEAVSQANEYLNQK
jgi:hypothetical protein